MQCSNGSEYDLYSKLFFTYIVSQSHRIWNAKIFYVDLDCYKDDITYSDYQTLLLSVKTTAAEIITDLSAYFKV